MPSVNTENFFRYLCQTSPEPLGLEIARAQGIYLFTRDDKRYIDFISGIGVANIGHRHPKVLAAIHRQLERHLHVMVYGEYVQDTQVEYARRLAELSPVRDGVVFFCNSGAEAIEGALKTARKFTGRKKYIAFTGGYHGDTYGALSAMSSAIYRAPFLPLLPEFEFLPFNDLTALSRIDEKAAAVIIEPVQGEGGVCIPSPEFLPTLRKRCDEVGALLIFDEVMTGFGRTGKLFASGHWPDANPDIVCLAKALGGGLPLGAFMGRREIMKTLSENPPLAHVTTFGGHPLSCAAGLAALDVLLQEKLIARSAELGQFFLNELQALAKKTPIIREVRGLGCFFAIEFRTPAATQQFVQRCREQGLVIGWTLHHSAIVRAAPPLCMTDEQAQEAQRIIAQSVFV
ncbi:MAG: aspartate aminotransferase family protein [candidate division KSB1 bacterium]|nr:aspartate aminotransferase family protein [candidate division KSB1 bacterium]MDZ7364475.1 aspartate aminotransferase family protein [candidate division KSB1 bacterium]MDZ7402847.1 aspartate aminotransferase family protein [candidate division KSB1 bacterium]